MARQRGTKWQGDVLWQGKRERRTFDSQAQAKKFEADPASFFAPKVTVKETFRLGWRNTWGGTKNESDTYRTTEELITMIGEDAEPKSITKATVMRLHDAWKANGLSNKRINRKLSVLRRLLDFCWARDYMEVVPRIKNLKEDGGKERYISVEEEWAIRNHLKQAKHKAFFDFLLYTGGRYSEVRELKWDQIRPDRVTFIATNTKSGKARTVPLVKRAQKALQTIAQPGFDPWECIEYNTWHEDFTQARQKAGISDDVVPHTLRHTCASRLVQRGVDIRRVKDWLGHSSITTTMIYAHLAPDDLLSVAHVLDTEALHDKPVTQGDVVTGSVPRKGNLLEMLGMSE